MLTEFQIAYGWSGFGLGPLGVSTTWYLPTFNWYLVHLEHIGKDKPAYILVPRHEDHPPTESGAQIIADESGIIYSTIECGLAVFDQELVMETVKISVANIDGAIAGASGTVDLGKKKVILLKGKEREGSQENSLFFNSDSNDFLSVLTGVSQQRNVTASVRNSGGSPASKQGFINDKRTKNKDRPDHTAWIHRHSDGFHGNDDTLSLSESLENMSIPHHTPATGTSKLGDDISGNHRNPSSSHVDMRVDQPNSSRSGEVKTIGSIKFPQVWWSSLVLLEGMKDVDGSLYLSEGKTTKRGGATGYGSHECEFMHVQKQVWVQKSGSGT
ncbi:hypothetical protein IFM89_011238 [Coptis chinensis]|uniref:Uncharacterized protein n=1 Tax=Coptis chinensis TaxID=261450 RepID=A0A835LMP9_9MAGN|nr:hypothetical protein IFM89_011238 [Coptis chinensis]